MKEDTFLIVYEVPQVDEAEKILRTYEKEGKQPPRILAIDAEVEDELTERNLPFISGRQYRGPVNLDRFFQSSEIARKIFEIPEWEALQYRDVPMRILATFPFRLYAVRILYYAELFLNAAKDHKEISHWIICESAARVLPTSGVLAREEVDVVVRAAKLVGETLGIVVEAHPLPRREQARSSLGLLRIKLSRALFETALFLYNAIMRLFARKHALRIAASDYWSQLSPIFQHLPHAELLLYDRSEIREIPFRDLWRHRVRFARATKPLGRVRNTALDEKWRKMREALPQLSYRELDLRPVYLEILDAFYTDAIPRALSTIDEAHEMLGKYRPHALLLRASISRQLHFAILAIVARTLGIPSIEIQHGHEYVGEGALGTERAAEYMAVYGPLSQREYQNIGYKKENLLVVGSPRFDVYKHVQHEPKPGTLRLLLVVPWFGVGVSQLDAYDFYDYIHALGAAIKNVGADVEVVLKMRPGRHREEHFYRVLESGFKDVKHTIAQYENLDSLFAKTDAVITGHSTVVLEAMSAGVPVVLYGQYSSQIERLHTQYSAFIEESAVAKATSPAELTRLLSGFLHDETTLSALSEKGRTSLHKHFLFDGDSGKRIAEFLKKY